MKTPLASVSILFLLAGSLTTPAMAQSQLSALSPNPISIPGTASLDKVPQGLEKSDWTSIRAAHQSWQHSVQPVPDAPGRWQARNPGQQWTTEFDGRGFTTRAKGADWEWGLELKSYGFQGNAMRTNGQPQATPDGQRMAYQWDANVQEWWINDQRGLEHGFTIKEQPAGASKSALLEIELSVRGTLWVSMAVHAQTIHFRDSLGAPVVTYTGLKAWDSDGKDLPASFATGTEGGLILKVDEREARYPLTIDPIAQQAYLKAPSGTAGSGAGDNFGSSVAVSGNTVVIGATGEDSSTTGVNSTPDEGASNSGAAYVFLRSGTTWTQQAYLKAGQVTGGDQFGISVAVSGNTVVVGADGEDSSTNQVNSTPDESGDATGAAYVFVRNGTTWSQEAYLKASQVKNDDCFGASVAVSGDTVVVGAYLEDSSTTGVNSTPDQDASNIGAAYVFIRSGTTWSQQAYLKASQVTDDDHFGASVAVNGDTVVVGASGEDSSTTGVNHTPNESRTNAGAAYVFVRTGSIWTQQAYLKAHQVSDFDNFGCSVAVSGDTVAVGASGEDSSTTGVNPLPDEGASESGAAFVFVRSGTTWRQQAHLKASHVSPFDKFGASVAVSGDTVVVGAYGEDSSTTGVNRKPDENANAAGAAYVFGRNGATWTQQAYLKASQVSKADVFGNAVAVSGNTVIVGANCEDSSTSGVNRAPDESAEDSGAAYVFVRGGTTWSQQAYLKSGNHRPASDDQFGTSVAVCGDTVVVGAPLEDSSTTGVNSTPNESASNAGAAFVFVRSGTTWMQQAYLKPRHVRAGDFFGNAVAVSGDTVIIGAYQEGSSTMGVNSTPNQNASQAGAAFVFVRSGTTWSQQAYLKASQVSDSDFFGWSVAVSGDTVVVGAQLEDSSTTGVNSTPDESLNAAGAAYVFVRSGTTWSQQAYLKASEVTAFDSFGHSVAVSGDTVIAGAPLEDSIDWRVNSLPDDSLPDSGAAFIFVRSGTTWTQQAYLKAIQATAGDFFGATVAVSGDTVVVGAEGEDSSTTGVNPVPDESASESGAAHVFVRSGTTWTQQAYLKASQVTAGDLFGSSVAVSGDTVVVGARLEDSSTTGVNSTPDEGASESGAAYVFVRRGSSWIQQAYVKASQVTADDFFGNSVAVSRETVVVGALNEDSSTTGVNSTPDDLSRDTGAVYIITGLGSPPTLTTPTSTNITANSAWLGGNVTADGGPAIIERGVVYAATATHADPTIGGNGVHQVITTGTTGIYTSAVSGLSPDTGYSFKAYATNALGTSYSSVATFTTNAGLANLVLNSTPLTPAFSTAVSNYTVSVPYAASDTITLTATASEANATLELRVNGERPIPLNSGVPSAPFVLPTTSTTLDVVVTAQDGTTQATYGILAGRLQRPLAQTITFDPPKAVFLSQSPLSLQAMASSGLPVSFELVSGPATSAGNLLTLSGAGTAVVRATQPGAGNYASARPVTRSIAVKADPTTLTFVNLNQTYDAQPKPVEVLGADPVTITYTIRGVEGSTPPVDAGLYRVKAVAGSFSKTATLIIGKATLTVTPGDQHKFAGTPNPPLTVQISGFQGTDTEAVLTRSPIPRTTAKESSPGGQYPITASGAAAANYRFLYLQGSLFVDTFSGNYEGLLTDASSVPVAKLAVNVASTNKSFSARLFAAGETSAISLRGPLETNPDLHEAAGSANVRLRNGRSYEADLTIPFSGALRMSVKRDNALLASSNEGQELAVFSSVAYLGAHTAILQPAQPAAFTVPAGAGWATGTIARTGALTLRGRLGDGTNFTTALDPDRAPDPGYRLFVQPYRPLRADTYIAGEFHLEPHPDVPDRRYLPPSSLTWVKAPRSTDASYRGGFDPVTVYLGMEPWLPPTADTPSVPAVTLAERLGLSGPPYRIDSAHGATGSLSHSDLPTQLSLAANNTVAVVSPVTTPLNLTKWRVTLASRTGTFSGSFELNDNGQRRPVSFSGVLRQAPSTSTDGVIGQGHYVLPALPGAPSNALQTGEILLQIPADN